MAELQIYRPIERAAVRVADLVLTPLRWRTSARPTSVRRVLLLRLERIGDLLMTLDAVAAARQAWPDADIDLAVGSWNAPIARLVRGVRTVLVLDVPWLARESRGHAWGALLKAARGWRTHRYDLVLNFEPDIRSNVLAWLSGAPARIGYSSGGGGALLTSAAPYDPRSHVSTNALRLVERAAGHAPRFGADARTHLALPQDAIDRAHALVAGGPRPLIALHASGGRPSKQWHLQRFGDAARQIAQASGGTVVLTGSVDDRPLVNEVRSALGSELPVVDLSGGLDLVELAAVLREADVLVTGDTGPMHLAAAVGTPVVALFGPSNPDRYGPGPGPHQVLRVDLPCSPCGQVRRPPARCRGHVPDCLDLITVDRVVAATLAALTHAREIVRRVPPKPVGPDSDC